MILRDSLTGSNTVLVFTTQILPYLAIWTHDSQLRDYSTVYARFKGGLKTIGKWGSGCKANIIRSA
jgi:hypothetical protein